MGKCRSKATADWVGAGWGPTAQRVICFAQSLPIQTSVTPKRVFPPESGLLFDPSDHPRLVQLTPRMSCRRHLMVMVSVLTAAKEMQLSPVSGEQVHTRGRFCGNRGQVWGSCAS